MDLTYEKAKTLLEGVLRLVYMAEWMPRLEESRKAKEAHGGDVSHGDEASLGEGKSSLDRLPT